MDLLSVRPRFLRFFLFRAFIALDRTRRFVFLVVVAFFTTREIFRTPISDPQTTGSYSLSVHVDTTYGSKLQRRKMAVHSNYYYYHITRNLGGFTSPCGSAYYSLLINNLLS